MTEQEMTARTESMTARTESFSFQPSRTAQATRSWAAVKRITNPAQRRVAMGDHFDTFPPVIVSAYSR